MLKTNEVHYTVLHLYEYRSYDHYWMVYPSVEYISRVIKYTTYSTSHKDHSLIDLSIS